MTFPTKEEIEFFNQPEVREFFRARWKPKFGDYTLHTKPGRPWFKDKESEQIMWILQVTPVDEPPEEMIWLPRPDQLVEMLEEKGYKRIELDIRPADCEATISQHPTEWARMGRGPTPAIALALALMEIG